MAWYPSACVLFSICSIPFPVLRQHSPLIHLNSVENHLGGVQSDIFILCKIFQKHFFILRIKISIEKYATHTQKWTQKNKFVKTNVERRKKKDSRNSFLFVPCSCSALFKIIEMENHSSLKNHRFYLWLMNNKREIKFKFFLFIPADSSSFGPILFYIVFALLFVAIYHSV